MKKLLPLLIPAILLIVASCKKDAPKQSTLPASLVSGTYKATAITGFNDDGTTYVETIPSCDQNNTETFSASGAYTQTSQCTTIPNVTGTWKMVKDTLIVYHADNSIFLKGLVTNATTAGFTLDENAINWYNDRITFVKQ